jgi:hypothetical protein
MGGGITSSNDIGIWSGAPGSLRLVAREGDPAPGVATGRNFSSFGSISLNDGGHTAFRANLTGLTTAGIWTDSSGVLAPIALEGSQVLGLPNGTTFKALSSPQLSATGRTAFHATIQGPGVSPFNDDVLCLQDVESLRIIVRESNYAPGTPSGTTLEGAFWIGFSPFSLTPTGKLAFQSDLAGTGIDDSNDVGIWSNSSGWLALVAREGDQAPGTPIGANFSRFAFDTASSLVVQKSFAQSSDGRLAFWAQLTGTGVSSANDIGIWSEGPGALQLIAREGDIAPGLGEQARFKTFFADSVLLNSTGQTAFVATLEGDGITAANDQGIWIYDPTGASRLIIREGDVAEVATNDFRTFASFTPVNNKFQLNDLGQVAFMATFTDNSQAILVSQLAESLPGDFDSDGDVDGRDFLTWQRDPSVGSLVDWQTGYADGVPHVSGDFDNDGDVDGRDFLEWQRGNSSSALSAPDLVDWQNNYGSGTLSASTVPEPSYLAILMGVVFLKRRRTD